MKILVFGLGALGTVYSCLLQRQGHEVSGVDRDFVTAQVKENGVRVEGIWGEHSARLKQVVSRVEDLADRNFDLIVVSVKAYETKEVAKKLASLMKNNTYIVLAQNGYGNFEAASACIPREKIILARVIFGSETIVPGQARVTVIADDVILGSPASLIDTHKLNDFARIFSQAGIPTRVSEDIMQYIWGKIIYNSSLNPLGAILEVPYGKLAEIEQTKSLISQMIEEIFQVLQAIGQPMMWADAKEYREVFFGQLIPNTASHHASMLQDIQRGRKTEIDALNGAVVELGKKYGIATPANEFVTCLLKAKENILVQ